MEREALDIVSDLESDCSPLNGLLEKVFAVEKNIHVLRDPTRGGLGTTLNEIARQSDAGIKLYEDKIPLKEQVRGICEMLGLDPLYMANEGKMIIILPRDSAEKVLNILKNEKLGQNSSIIGEVTGEHRGRVTMKTVTGGSRIVDVPVGDQLPRIC